MDQFILAPLFEELVQMHDELGRIELLLVAEAKPADALSGSSFPGLEVEVNLGRKWGVV